MLEVCYCLEEDRSVSDQEKGKLVCIATEQQMNTKVLNVPLKE